MNDSKFTLTRREAAALCGLTPSGFDRWVRQGIVPGRILGSRRWSRAAVKAAVDVQIVDVDASLDPYVRQKAERARHADHRRQPARHDDRISTALGKREREMLIAIYEAGGAAEAAALPGGPATLFKLAARGYFPTRADGTFDIRLTPAGRQAAEAIRP